MSLEDHLLEQNIVNCRTLNDLLQYVARLFADTDLSFGHGTDNAWDEALHLILPLLNLSLMSGDEVLNFPLFQADHQLLIAAIKLRVKARIPVPYITHQAWFLQQSFYVDPRVLIPRSPLGEWIERQFTPWCQNPAAVTRLLDIGTGSGSLAISLAHYFPQAFVDAIDASVDALQVAEQNIRNYHLEKRVQLILAHDLSKLGDERYDIVVSNPPYVAEEAWQALPPEYHHEPKMALVTEDEGLALPIQLIQEVGNYLNENGLFFLEVGYNWPALNERFPDNDWMWLTPSEGGEGIVMITKQQLDALRK